MTNAKERIDQGKLGESKKIYISKLCDFLNLKYAYLGEIEKSPKEGLNLGPECKSGNILR